MLIRLVRFLANQLAQTFKYLSNSVVLWAPPWFISSCYTNSPLVMCLSALIMLSSFTSFTRLGNQHKAGLLCLRFHTLLVRLNGHSDASYFYEHCYDLWFDAWTYFGVSNELQQVRLNLHWEIHLMLFVSERSSKGQSFLIHANYA